MREQREAHWGTTQGDAWALLALTEYSRRVEGSLQPAAGNLGWGEESIPFRLNAEHPLFDKQFDWAGNAFPAILNSSPHPLYASATFAVRPAGATTPREDNGFGLQRSYQRLDLNNSPCSGDWAIGDLVLVTLELSAREAARYIVINDPLPAVLEPVGTGTDELDWMWTFHEFRKDRALFFADNLRAGNYTVRYFARVRASGQAQAPSGKVEEMYHPQRFGLTGAQRIEAK